MKPTEHQWEYWLERLYSLCRDKRGSHERPHKPLLLLSIIHLLDLGLIKTNAVPLTDDLIATFRRYFDIVKQEDDKPTIENPFHFLSGDRFWRVIPRGATEPFYREGYASSAPSVRQLLERGATGHFDEGLWTLFQDPFTRQQVREALIARHFPQRRKELEPVEADTSGRKPVMSRDTFPGTRRGLPQDGPANL